MDKGSFCVQQLDSHGHNQVMRKLTLPGYLIKVAKIEIDSKPLVS